VYCQLGRSVPLTNERREYYPSEEILYEVQETLASHKAGEIDWVTFVGSGEPTLHTRIGWLIRQVKAFTDLPVAVITNGALLYLPQVRQDLIAADAVLPSLDAGDAVLYRKINRPYPRITFDCFLTGLTAFRKEYWGKLWVEVMLVRNLNDTKKALLDIAEALQKIEPDQVHLNLPTRPPAETWVQPPDEEGLMRANAILGEIAELVHPADGTFDISGCDDVVEAIIGIITRHPMRQEQIEKTLSRWSPEQVGQTLAELEASNRAQIVVRHGIRFWSASPSHYPSESQSQATAPERIRDR
jgi:wyosine [tRNA(Phe)-imidazoG37] synthetase (radical SAM superfamily)